jgi:hypothetical protein
MTLEEHAVERVEHGQLELGFDRGAERAKKCSNT